MTESVWDYPRPPRVEATNREIVIIHQGITIARTASALRVLETSHPPVFYLPPGDVRVDLLEPVAHRTFCEFKGVAHYADLAWPGGRVARAAWFYPQPIEGYAELAHYYAFYPGRVDECTVAGERVRAQAGGFYGGWITDDVTGPFKG